MSDATMWACRTSLGLCLALVVAAPSRAQETTTRRAAASVDYVGVEGLYLTVGSDQGAARGDTVAVYAHESDVDRLGWLVFTSVSRRRAVAISIDPAIELRIGEVVYIALARPIVADAPGSVASPAPERPAPRAAYQPSGPRISGRIALDIEARESRTAWAGDLFGETRRRFATPTARLSLLVSDLPGGFDLRASVRASYRHAELAAGPPPTSIRAYEFAAVRSFDRVPLEVMIGRFSNPHESYGAYWDGALFRVGRPSGLGVGAVVGYEPQLHNEAFSRAVPKLGAFVDFAAAGLGWRYDTDMSLHVVRAGPGAHRRFVGWSQRVRLARLALSQRLRADGQPGGERWSLTELRLRGSLEVVGPLRLTGAYSRSRGLSPLLPQSSSQPASPVRRQLHVGLDLLGRRTSLSLEGGRTDRDGDEPAWSLGASSSLRLRAAELLVSGRRWARGGREESWSVAPMLSWRASWWDWRVGYRLYETAGRTGALATHSVDGQVGWRIRRATRVSLRGERQWGRSLSGTRLHFGVWRSF